MSLGFRRWGSWEELVLGGAVLRHGTDAWDSVAGEVTARSSSPNPFNAQECMAKYEEIQEQYSGSDAWFEELRKRRVSELKRKLEKSDDSIGSLQSKLESLTYEKETGSNFGHYTSQTESTSPIEDVETIDSSGKQVSGDGSSAGSFTEKTGRGLTQKCQNLASVSVPENNLKMQLEKSSMEKFGCGCLGIGFGSFRKQRGKRKRKGSDMLSSAAFTNREGSEGGCNQDTNPSSEDCDRAWMREDNDDHLDLAGIMDSIIKQKDVSIFRVRLESQKRARYKKMIRRHVDFPKLSSSIGNGSISSSKELFRDFLLLCNNALVFYPNNSDEHKSALILRDIVNKRLRSFRSQNPTYSCSDEVAVPKKADKPKKYGSPVEENAKVAQRTEGIRNKKNAAVAGKGVGTKETAVVTGKGAGIVLPLKENATVGGNRCKENAVSEGKVAGTLRKQNAAVVPGKDKGTLLKEKGNNNKRSRADIAVESARNKKRNIGRPVNCGQQGGRQRQESVNKGRKIVNKG